MEPGPSRRSSMHVAALWERRARRRDHARSQSDLGRGRALRRLRISRRQSRVAGRAGARRRRLRPRPEHSADEALARARPGRDISRVSLRPDLCPAGPDRRRLGGRARARRSRHAGEHLSLYQLTIERGTRSPAHAAGRFTLPDEDAGRRVRSHLTQELCEAAGLPAYEISNHARPGRVAA